MLGHLSAIFDDLNIYHVFASMGAIHGEHGEGFLGHIALNIWNFKKSFWHKLHLIRVC